MATKKIIGTVRPAHSSELCPICGTGALDPSATGYGCEHGSWTLVDPEPDQTISEPNPADVEL